MTTTNSEPLCPPPRPNNILFGWHVRHGNLPSILVSSDRDAQIKPHPSQMTPCPDRPLLLLWRALDFAPLPLPTTFTRIPPFKVIAIASIDDTQETRCVLCLYLWPMQHRVIYTRLFGKQKRLPVKSTPLFGTTELDQGEANVCIWQDTNKAKEVPFKKKKYSGLKHGRRESERKEIKSITISTPSLGSEWRKKIYCILL